MSLHRNRVQMTVSAVDGVTGELTLNAATSGYQSFTSAYGADATVDILITEGTSWEVDRNCAYDNTGGTVDRGTFEASSSGSAVSFTSAAVVSVIATAAAGNNWGLNEISASPTGAGVTGVVGTLHILDISGLSADQDFTLPATCAVGDRVGVFIKTGDPDYELLLKPASGDTINGGSAGAEWSRLFISNECVIFRCITADTDWIVEYDGRIPCVAGLSSAGVSMANNTVIRLTSAQWTADFNQGNAYVTSGTHPAFKARRAGKYQTVVSGASASMADARIWYVRVETSPNGTPVTKVDYRATTGVAERASGTALFISDLAVGDEILGHYFHNQGTTVTSGSLSANFTEIL